MLTSTRVAVVETDTADALLLRVLSKFRAHSASALAAPTAPVAAAEQEYVLKVRCAALAVWLWPLHVTTCLTLNAHLSFFVFALSSLLPSTFRSLFSLL